MTSPQFKWGSESRYTFVMQKPIRLQLVDFKMKKKWVSSVTGLCKSSSEYNLHYQSPDGLLEEVTNTLQTKSKACKAQLGHKCQNFTLVLCIMEQVGLASLHQPGYRLLPIRSPQLLAGTHLYSQLDRGTATGRMQNNIPSQCSNPDCLIWNLVH